MALDKAAVRRLNRKFESDAHELRDVLRRRPSFPSRRLAQTLERLERHMREGERLLAQLDSGGSNEAKQSNKAELKRLRLLIAAVHHLGDGVAAKNPKTADRAISAADKTMGKWGSARRQRP